MGNSLIIVISLTISLNYVNCRLGVGVKDNLASEEMSSLMRKCSSEGERQIPYVTLTL